MHILHTESSCGWGGQEIRILTEAAGMRERGHEVTLIAPPQSNIYRVAPDYGLERVALPIERKTLKGLWALRSWLQSHAAGLDLINTHSSTDSWLVALANLFSSHALPVVRTRHVSSAVNRRATTRWLYQRAAQHVVVTGEALRRQLVEDNGFDPDSMTSVPTGIDLQRFRPRERAEVNLELGLPGDGFVVGILATLRSWKGHDYLLQAFADLLPDDNLRLLIVGDGPQRENLERRCDELGLRERVRFAGNQSNPELWLNAMDLFVLPSYGNEGVSQAVMQAMASRLPVITTAVGGMTEAVQHESTGLLVETRSSDAIAATIRRLHGDADERERLADAALARAQERFSRERMLDRMEEIFSRFVRPGEG